MTRLLGSVSILYRTCLLSRQVEPQRPDALESTSRQVARLVEISRQVVIYINKYIWLHVYVSGDTCCMFMYLVIEKQRGNPPDH